MDHTPQPENLLSLSQISRKLDIPYNRAFRLLHEGKITPDFSTPRAKLFRPERLPELRATLEASQTH